MEIRRLSAEQLVMSADDLADVLVDCVEGGASVSFMLPYSHDQARAFWRELVPAVAGGAVVLLAAGEGPLVGTVQLQLATPPNQPHRAGVAKLLVRRSARGRGVGRTLMLAAEDEARAVGRTLLTLDTITDGAGDRLYRRLGWTFVGAIPDYARMPDGPLAPTSIFYKRL
jgi:GNAT superfamily N-acetyltransferase